MCQHNLVFRYTLLLYVLQKTKSMEWQLLCFCPPVC